ncbi:ABC transporter ATP-binding protein [Dongia sp.]|uniref:ABC transporter ATP-binding protein n=1 Tax=Dongia sp. TaxID=1977262 RepID=UPI0035B341C5
MADVKVSQALKRFGSNIAVREADFAAAAGEFIALLGPSGCGKTTLLRLLAGFERLDGGRIEIGGKRMSAIDLHVPTEERRLGMVFQSYALWPHMSVSDNVAFGLRIRRLRRAEIEVKVKDALATVGLSAMGDRLPAALSGGQRQRVALARCLAMDPEVVLLDEPLANLDAHLREAMQREFRSFHRRIGATMVYVTHDQAEALALADRVAVMMGGEMRQIASPREIYRCPADADVARFIGRGSVADVNVQQVGGGSAPGCQAILGSTALTLRCRPGRRTGQAQACFRPEEIVILPTDATSVGHSGAIVSAHVQSVRYSGMRQEVELILDEVPQAQLHGIAPADLPLGEGQAVRTAITGGWVIG